MGEWAGRLLLLDAASGLVGAVAELLLCFVLFHAKKSFFLRSLEV